jgi:hypothetical protein
MRDDEMTDAALDDEITQALAVDPSPALVARIRRRVETEHVPGVWAGSGGSRMAVVVGAAVATAIAFLASHGGVTRGSVPLLVAHTIPHTTVDPALGVPSWRGAPVLAARVGGGTRDTGLAFTPASARPERRATPGAGGTPEVLVDPREARALRSLIDDARSGRLDLTGFLDPTVPAVIEAEPIRNIYIAPIELTALTSDEQGVPR